MNNYTWTDLAPGRYFVGCDLGTLQDYTCLTIAERRGDDRQSCHLSIAAMKRYELGTGYSAIVEDLARRLEHAPKDTALIVDATGCGLPVYQWIQRHPLMHKRIIRGIQITGGDAESYGDGGLIRVPKRNLVSSLQILLQSGRLKIAAGLPETDILLREMRDFRSKITVSGHDVYEPWRSGQHDDMVLAAALSAWAAIHPSHFQTWRVSDHPRLQGRA